MIEREQLEQMLQDDGFVHKLFAVLLRVDPGELKRDNDHVRCITLHKDAIGSSYVIAVYTQDDPERQARIADSVAAYTTVSYCDGWPGKPYIHIIVFDSSAGNGISRSKLAKGYQIFVNPACPALATCENEEDLLMALRVLG